jgi:hypothetical protein
VLPLLELPGLRLPVVGLPERRLPRHLLCRPRLARRLLIRARLLLGILRVLLLGVLLLRVFLGRTVPTTARLGSGVLVRGRLRGSRGHEHFLLLALEHHRDRRTLLIRPGHPTSWFGNR